MCMVIIFKLLVLRIVISWGWGLKLARHEIGQAADDAAEVNDDILGILKHIFNFYPHKKQNLIFNKVMRGSYPISTKSDLIAK